MGHHVGGETHSPRRVLVVVVFAKLILQPFHYTASRGLPRIRRRHTRIGVGVFVLRRAPRVLRVRRLDALEVRVDGLCVAGPPQTQT